MDQRRQNRSGFTLIELMIVVVIIGILAMIAIPKFVMAGWKAKEKEAEVFLKQIYTAQQAHRTKAGALATTLAELQSTGVYEESTLSYYTLPAAADYALPLCLRATGDWADKQIDALGQISDC